MVARIKVGFSSKIQAMNFSPVEETDSLELDVDYKDEEDLSKQIEKWQNFIQNKVVKATFTGANKLVEAKKELDKD